MEGGATLEALAGEARAVGLKWSTARVVDLERGKLSPTLPMLIALSYALTRATGESVRLPDLIEHEGSVEINDRLTISGKTLADVVVGERLFSLDRALEAVAEAQSNYPDSVRTLGDAYIWESYSLGDERASKRLGWSKEVLTQRSAALWGKNLSAERDERAGPGASAQKRGQITRALLEELRSVDNGND